MSPFEATGPGRAAGARAARRVRSGAAPTTRKPAALPGFGLTLGVTLTYLGLIVLVPLIAVLVKASTLSLPQFLHAVGSARVLASYRLTFGTAFGAALLNVVFGFLVAWVLVRYDFPGKRLVDALVDLPFALPTAVAGIALATVYSAHGWIGAPAATFGIKLAFTPLGVLIALTFIGLPFVVRTVQPVLEGLEREQEEAAASLGGSRWMTFRRIVLPVLVPALLTGFALALARGIGEYGSVIFIAGNVPMRSEITALLIITRLEQYDYASASALAVAMLGASFIILLILNLAQWGWPRRFRAPREHHGRGASTKRLGGSMSSTLPTPAPRANP